MTPAVEATDIVDAPELISELEEESQVLDELPEVEALPELTEEANLSVNGTHPKAPDLTQGLVQASEEFEQPSTELPVEEIEEETPIQEAVEEPKEELDALPQFGLLGDLPVEAKTAEEVVPETTEIVSEAPVVQEEVQEDSKMSFLDGILTENTETPVVAPEAAPAAPTSTESAPEFIELDGFDFDMEEEEEEEEIFPHVIDATPEPEAPVFPDFDSMEDTSSEEILAQEPEVAPEPVEMTTPPPVEAVQPEASIEETDGSRT